MNTKRNYKNGSYIAGGLLILVVIGWFGLVHSGYSGSSLAHPAGAECFFDTRTGEECTHDFPCVDSVECEKVRDTYTTTLASLEEYLLDGGYVPAVEKRDPTLDAVVISTRDVAMRPWQMFLHTLTTSQLATASRSLFSEEGDGIVADPYVLPENPTVWDLANIIIPPDYLQKVIEYREETDGPRNMLAYVESLDSHGSTWALVIDPADAYSQQGFNDPQKLITTLVHEFGHALSLNENQINHRTHTCAEGVYKALEGCALEGAYLQTFVDTFWSDTLSEFLQLSEGQKLGFYGTYRDRFVNSYAASDPGEDFAESFAYFVVTKQRGGDSIASKKLEYFYSDPEFVRIRDYMRRQMVIALNAMQ